MRRERDERFIKNKLEKKQLEILKKNKQHFEFESLKKVESIF